MKNIVRSLICLFVLGISLQALSFAPESQTKKIRVGNFQSLEIGHDFDVQIIKGNVCSITATGRADDLEKLDVQVEGNTLKFDIDASWSWMGYNKNHKKIKLLITLPRIKSAEFSGASHVNLRGFNDEEQMNITVSGASHLAGDSIQADKLVLELSGASHAKLSGRIAKLDLELSGASHLNAEELLSRDADIEASGASHAQVTIQKSLQVEASGASKVEYRGNPMNLTKDVSGASTVRRAN
jgi:hypothetical protein